MELHLDAHLDRHRDTESRSGLKPPCQHFLNRLFIQTAAKRSRYPGAIDLTIGANNDHQHYLSFEACIACLFRVGWVRLVDRHRRQHTLANVENPPLPPGPYSRRSVARRGPARRNELCRKELFHQARRCCVVDLWRKSYLNYHLFAIGRSITAIALRFAVVMRRRLGGLGLRFHFANRATVSVTVLGDSNRSEPKKNAFRCDDELPILDRRVLNAHDLAFHRVTWFASRDESATRVKLQLLTTVRRLQLY